MKIIIVVSLCLLTTKSFAQTDSIISPLTLSGYVEAYYSYDLAQPPGNNRPAFAYCYNRHNEINLNLGYIKANWQKKAVRANFAIAAGTYMNANYAAEPGVLKNIYEANAGVKISEKKELWVDAGIFASHIGFESAVGKDCWNLTRSMAADNSPYYETGAKLSYLSNNGKWFISGLVLNGWQRIQRIDGNSTPAFGHQLIFKPNSKIVLNSSSFIGNDKPDSARLMRYFHNFYGSFQLTPSLALITGFDIGAEQKIKGGRQFNCWYSPVIILKVSPGKKNNISVRAEYYSDEGGVIIPTGTLNGFKTLGYSLNYDYIIRENVMWRIEGRGLSSKDRIFTKDSKPVKNNCFFTTSLAVSF
jgi:hypothetical protein